MLTGRRGATWGIVFALIGTWAIGCGGGKPPAPLVAAVQPAVSPRPSAITGEPPALRLPDDVHALAERLDLRIDPRLAYFQGVADLDIRLDQPRSVIWLHGLGLKTSRVTLRRGGVEESATWSSVDNGFASITTEKLIAAGNVTLHIEYTAEFSPNDVGVSRVDRDAEKYVFTQFALTDARRAFPCFDEPNFKYIFDVTLTVPPGNEAISNAPELRRSISDASSLVVHFRPTPPLPAYLVMFAVGPFDVFHAADVPPSAVRSKPLPLRGISAKGRGKDWAYATNRAAATVLALEDYFAEPFPFEKLDLVAVPNKSGAMENAGAITFAESAVLVNDATASLEQRHDVLGFVTHEIAHQWFGDLVTMPWWDDTWLNEGFATWMSTKISNRIDPEEHFELDGASAAARAMGIDSRDTSHSIRQPISSPDAIASVLDSIAYTKSAAVLGMFERWMGPDVFRDGLRQLTLQYRYGSATSDDLLAALSSAARRDVSGPFRTFLDQPGVPLLKVLVSCGEKPHLQFEQSRYRPIGAQLGSRGAWSVPVCVRYGVKKEKYERCDLVEGERSEMPLQFCPDWLVPNADAVGYYHAELTHSDVARMIANVDELSDQEAIAMLSDFQAALLGGYGSPADAFALPRALVGRKNPEVLDRALTVLSLARSFIYGDPALPAFEGYCRALARPVYKALGWDPRSGDDAATTQRRAAVIDFLAQVANDREVRAEAGRRSSAFLGYRGDGRIHQDKLDPNLAATALTVAGEDADDSLFDAILNLLNQTSDAVTRAMLVKVLGSARAPALAARARQLAISGELHSLEPELIVEKQFIDPQQREAVWQWLRANSARIFALTPERVPRQRMLGLVGLLCDNQHDRDVSEFTSRMIPSVAGGERLVANARARASICAAQRAALEAPVGAFFANHGKAAP